MVLFHANHRPEDAPFADELDDLAAADPMLTFVPTMTATPRSDRPWDGERGRFEPGLLQRHLEGIDQPIYYIAGPAGMVQATRAMLVAAHVDEDDIRTEEFTGY